MTSARTNSLPVNPTPARPVPAAFAPAKPEAQMPALQAERRAIRLAARQATGIGGF
jgi:hypothetical protein